MKSVGNEQTNSLLEATATDSDKIDNHCDMSVILLHIVQYYYTLYNTTTHCTILLHIVLYYYTLSNTTTQCTILLHIVQYYYTLYNTTTHCTILLHIVQYYYIVYNTTTHCTSTSIACTTATRTRFLQVRENWKKSGNLSGQGKSGEIFFGKVREND